MRFRRLRPWIWAGFFAAAAARAQTNAQEVFNFAHTPDIKSAQAMATAIRTVLETPQIKVSDDNPPSTLTVNGTPDQLKAAGWLFTELDQTAPAARVREYQLPSGAENIVRIYYVTTAHTIPQFQEIATAIRTVVEIRRLFTYNPQKAIIARSTPEQMDLFDWLLPLMDRPVNAKPQHSISPQSRVIPEPREETTMEVFYAGYAPSVKDFQTLATAIRTIAGIRRVFTYNEAQAIAIRGKQSELTMAEWLFNLLDQPGSGPASGSFSAGGPDDMVRAFDLSHAKASQDLPNVITQIRGSSKSQYAVSYGSRSILLLRGTTAQMAAAERLVEQLSKP